MMDEEDEDRDYAALRGMRTVTALHDLVLELSYADKYSDYVKTDKVLEKLEEILMIRGY